MSDVKNMSDIFNEVIDELHLTEEMKDRFLLILVSAMLR
jgi:hypothetical protein